MTAHALTASVGVTHRLCRPDSSQGGIGQLVLLNLTRGVLPAHAQAAGCGVVHLEVPGRFAGHCGLRERVRGVEGAAIFHRDNKHQNVRKTAAEADGFTN